MRIVARVSADFLREPFPSGMPAKSKPRSRVKVETFDAGPSRRTERHRSPDAAEPERTPLRPPPRGEKRPRPLGDKKRANRGIYAVIPHPFGFLPYERGFHFADATSRFEGGALFPEHRARKPEERREGTTIGKRIAENNARKSVRTPATCREDQLLPELPVPHLGGEEPEVVSVAGDKKKRAEYALRKNDGKERAHYFGFAARFLPDFDELILLLRSAIFCSLIFRNEEIFFSNVSSRPAPEC